MCKATIALLVSSSPYALLIYQLYWRDTSWGVQSATIYAPKSSHSLQADREQDRVRGGGWFGGTQGDGDICSWVYGHPPCLTCDVAAPMLEEADQSNIDTKVDDVFEKWLKVKIVMHKYAFDPINQPIARREWYPFWSMWKNWYNEVLPCSWSSQLATNHHPG